MADVAIATPITTPASPIVRTDNATAGQPVHIVIEPRESKTETPPVDPNSPEERAVTHPVEDWRIDPLHHELSHFLEIDPRSSEQYAERVNEILNFCIEKTGSTDPDKIFQEVRRMDENLYRMNFNEPRVNALYRYIQLNTRRDAVDRAMKSMEKKSKWG